MQAGSGGQRTSGMEEDRIGNRSPRRNVASALGEKEGDACD